MLFENLGHALYADYFSLCEQLTDEQLDLLRRERGFVNDEVLPVIGGRCERSTKLACHPTIASPAPPASGTPAAFWQAHVGLRGRRSATRWPYETAFTYAKRREQAGRALCSFQIIQESET